MENRYRILSIDKRVRYATGMPVVLQSSALTIDTQTNCVLVQLKFLSISPKSLASMKVSILPRDGAKRQLGEPVFHTYLDLEVKRDQEFGAKEAIFLPDNTARYFDILVVEAVFKDGSILPVNAEPDLVIPEQQRLETKLSENYLAAYKKLLSKSGIEYIEEDFHDLWICGCGEINHEKETLCFKCGVKRTALVSAFDKDQLEPVVRNIETEKRKIAEQKKEEKILTEKRSRILIKKMVIGGAAIFIGSSGISVG